MCFSHSSSTRSAMFKSNFEYSVAKSTFTTPAGESWNVAQRVRLQTVDGVRLEVCVYTRMPPRRARRVCWVRSGEGCAHARGSGCAVCQWRPEGESYGSNMRLVRRQTECMLTLRLYVTWRSYHLVLPKITRQQGLPAWPVAVLNHGNTTRQHQL